MTLLFTTRCGNCGDVVETSTRMIVASEPYLCSSCEEEKMEKITVDDGKSVAQYDDLAEYFEKQETDLDLDAVDASDTQTEGPVTAPDGADTNELIADQAEQIADLQKRIGEAGSAFVIYDLINTVLIGKLERKITDLEAVNAEVSSAALELDALNAIEIENLKREITDLKRPFFKSWFRRG